MRIGIDATAMPLKRVGAGNYILNLVQALARVDTNNEYFIFAKPTHIRELGIRQPNFHFTSVDISNRPIRLLWEQSVLPRQISFLEIDILHSPHYTMPFLKPCRSVVTFCDMTFKIMPHMHEVSKRIFFPAMMQWSAGNADRLIAISESTRQDVIRLLSVAPSKIVSTQLAASSSYSLLPPFQVESVVKRYNLTQGKYIYFVGALEPRKNVSVLIEAYAKLGKHFFDVPLIIAGKKGWMYDEIFKRVTALKLQERVRFLGYVPEQDLIALYNGARVFVYPSSYEGFGFPVLEAMQCGTPVITTNVSSMPEVAGDAALLVPPNDVDALSIALQRVLTDDVLAKNLSQRGLARAVNFSWQRCAKETLQVYESLCLT